MSFEEGNESIEQEIEWLREEISQDQFVIDHGSSSVFHRDRVEENQRKLNALVEVNQCNR